MERYPMPTESDIQQYIQLSPLQKYRFVLQQLKKKNTIIASLNAMQPTSCREQGLHVAYQCVDTIYLNLCELSYDLCKPYLEQNNFSEAINWLRVRLEWCKKVTDKDAVARYIAETHSLLAKCYSHQKKPDEAHQHYSLAYQQWQKLKPLTEASDLLLYISSCCGEGQHALIDERYKEAFEIFTEAEQICHQHFSHDKKLHISIAIPFSHALIKVDKFDDAIEKLSVARDILQQMLGQKVEEKRVIDLSHTLNLLAEISVREADYQAAVQLCQEAEQLLDQHASDHVVRVEALITLADVYNELHQWGQARSALCKALELREAHYGADSVAVADVCTNLGLLCERTGEDEQALTHLKRAETIYCNSHQRDGLADCLLKLGKLKSKQNHLSAALDYYQEAWRLKRELDGEVTQSVADILNNIGNVLCKDGQHDTALRLFNYANRIYQGKTPKPLKKIADTMFNIGVATIEKGDVATGIEKLLNSLNTFEQALAPDHAHIAAIKRSVCQLLFLALLQLDPSLRNRMIEKIIELTDALLAVDEGIIQANPQLTHYALARHQQVVFLRAQIHEYQQQFYKAARVFQEETNRRQANHPLLAIHNTEQAIRCYKLANQKDLVFLSQCYTTLAMLLYKQGQTLRAINMIDKAIASEDTLERQNLRNKWRQLQHTFYLNVGDDIAYEWEICQANYSRLQRQLLDEMSDASILSDSVTNRTTELIIQICNLHDKLYHRYVHNFYIATGREHKFFNAETYFPVARAEEFLQDKLNKEGFLFPEMREDFFTDWLRDKDLTVRDLKSILWRALKDSELLQQLDNKFFLAADANLQQLNLTLGAKWMQDVLQVWLQKQVNGRIEVNENIFGQPLARERRSINTPAPKDIIMALERVNLLQPGAEANPTYQWCEKVQFDAGVNNIEQFGLQDATENTAFFAPWLGVLVPKLKESFIQTRQRAFLQQVSYEQDYQFFARRQPQFGYLQVLRHINEDSKHVRLTPQASHVLHLAAAGNIAHQDVAIALHYMPPKQKVFPWSFCSLVDEITPGLSDDVQCHRSKSIYQKLKSLNYFKTLHLQLACANSDADIEARLVRDFNIALVYVVDKDDWYLRYDDETKVKSYVSELGTAYQALTTALHSKKFAEVRPLEAHHWLSLIIDGFGWQGPSYCEQLLSVQMQLVAAQEQSLPTIKALSQQKTVVGQQLGERVANDLTNELAPYATAVAGYLMRRVLQRGHFDLQPDMLVDAGQLLMNAMAGTKRLLEAFRQDQPTVANQPLPTADVVPSPTTVLSSIDDATTILCDANVALDQLQRADFSLKMLVPNDNYIAAAKTYCDVAKQLSSVHPWLAVRYYHRAIRYTGLQSPTLIVRVIRSLADIFNQPGLWEWRLNYLHAVLTIIKKFNVDVADKEAIEQAFSTTQQRRQQVLDLVDADLYLQWEYAAQALFQSYEMAYKLSRHPASQRFRVNLQTHYYRILTKLCYVLEQAKARWARLQLFRPAGIDERTQVNFAFGSHKAEFTKLLSDNQLMLRADILPDVKNEAQLQACLPAQVCALVKYIEANQWMIAYRRVTGDLHTEPAQPILKADIYQSIQTLTGIKVKTDSNLFSKCLVTLRHHILTIANYAQYDIHSNSSVYKQLSSQQPFRFDDSRNSFLEKAFSINNRSKHAPVSLISYEQLQIQHGQTINNYFPFCYPASRIFNWCFKDLFDDNYKLSKGFVVQLRQKGFLPKEKPMHQSAEQISKWLGAWQQTTSDDQRHNLIAKFKVKLKEGFQQLSDVELDIVVARLLLPIPGFAKYVQRIEPSWVAAAPLISKMLEYAQKFMETTFTDLPNERRALHRQANDIKIHGQLPTLYGTSLTADLVGLRLFQQPRPAQQQLDSERLQLAEDINRLMNG